MTDKIPEVIYLQWYGLDQRDMHNAKCDAEMLGNPYPDPIERTWCADRQYDTDVMYRRVRKQPKGEVDHLEQRVAELEEQLRDMTAACELWRKKAVPDWVQTTEEPQLSTRTGLPAIKLIYEPEEVGQGRSIAVTLLDHSIDYVLENVRWFLSMVYMWDVGELELKQVDKEEG